MHTSAILLLLFHMLFGTAPADSERAQAIDQLNLNYQYDLKAEVQFNYRLARKGQKATLFVALRIPSADRLGDYLLELSLRENYRSELISQRFELGFPSYAHQSVYYFKKEFQIGEGDELLVLKAQHPDRQKAYYFDMSLKETGSDLLLYRPGSDFPILDPFIAKDQPVEVRSLYSQEKLVHVFHYTHDFAAARAPMETKYDPRPAALQPDHRTHSLDSDSVFFNQGGLYFLQQDSSSQVGLAFYVPEHAFPKYDQLESLIGPVQYLCSQEEYNDILTAEKQKQAFDFQWITMAASADRARKVIKSYYQQVTQSNILFTTYKAGWKTDQGLIYTFLGAPDEVYRNGEREEWIYHENNNFSKIKFTFARINNLFTGRHYQLQRNRRYAPSWQRIVDLWRKGRILL